MLDIIAKVKCCEFAKSVIMFGCCKVLACSLVKSPSGNNVRCLVMDGANLEIPEKCPLKSELNSINKTNRRFL